MQRYLGDLHDGRIDPRSIHHDFNASQRAPIDAAQLLRDLPPDAAVRAAAPQLPLYGQLRELLTRYRALADDAAWRLLLPPLPAASRGAAELEPGQDWTGLPLLADRLVALGDLAAAAHRGRHATRAHWSMP